jgi:serine/threonine protein kinase
MVAAMSTASGVMMYQMLSGRLPFTSDKESYVEIVLGHLNQPVPPLVGGAGPIPGFLIQVVMRTLEKDPTLRPTARELLTDLVRVARYTIDSGATSGELALPRSEQFAGDGGLGLDAEKTGEVPALNVETSNASAKTLPPRDDGSGAQPDHRGRAADGNPNRPRAHPRVCPARQERFVAKSGDRAQAARRLGVHCALILS